MPTFNLDSPTGISTPCDLNDPLYVDRFKSGLFIINPGQGDTFTSHGRLWLDTERGFEMSREMFAPSRVFTTFKSAQ